MISHIFHCEFSIFSNYSTSIYNKSHRKILYRYIMDKLTYSSLNKSWIDTNIRFFSLTLLVLQKKVTAKPSAIPVSIHLLGNSFENLSSPVPFIIAADKVYISLSSLAKSKILFPNISEYETELLYVFPVSILKGAIPWNFSLFSSAKQ